MNWTQTQSDALPCTLNRLALSDIRGNLQKLDIDSQQQHNRLAVDRDIKLCSAWESRDGLGGSAYRWPTAPPA